MAREFTVQTDQSLTSVDAFVGPVVFSCGIWINPDVVTITQVVMSMRNSSSNSYMQFFSTNSGILTFRIEDGGTYIGRTTASNVISASTWQHIGGTWDGGEAASGINIYVDGLDVDNADDNNGTFIDREPGSVNWRIGAQTDSLDFQFDGDEAEAAIWDTELTANEMLMLAAGVSPIRVRPANLIGYSPIYGVNDPEPDLSGNGHNLTVEGTVNQSDHAPVGPMFGFDD